jgi:microsomal epoxide hydrolase
VKLTGNLVWSKIHDRGGHFAALEEPELLLEDVITFSKGFGEGVKGLEQGYKG